MATGPCPLAWGVCPVPTLPPHCCLNVVGGPPAHSHARLLLPLTSQTSRHHGPRLVCAGREEPERVPTSSALTTEGHRWRPGPGAWPPRSPEASALCCWGLLVPELAPGSVGTGTSSGRRQGVRVTGRPVSACPEKEGGGGPSLVFLRKGFCSEGQTGQM